MLMTEDNPFSVDDDVPPTDAQIERMIEKAPAPSPLPSRDVQGYRPRLLDPAVMAAEEGATFELLRPEDLTNLPDPEWLVNGVLPADTFAVLFGAPGSTKSFWSLDAACSVASGHKLHGSDVKPGRVIYAAGEGLRGLKWRLESWKLAHPDADMSALDENLRILPRAVRLLQEPDALKLLNTARSVSSRGQLRLVIVDTWARALTGGDENSSLDTGLAIDVCETVRHETGSTILVVHHSNKDGLSERGSTALRGAADAQMSMTKDAQTGVITLHCIKMKDSEEFEDRQFRLHQYGHSAVLLPHTAAFSGVFNGGQMKSRDEKYRNAGGNLPWEEPF